MGASPDWLQYGAPTLDRPFGLHLWPIFEAAFKQVKGYAPQQFEFTPGVTPMATMAETAITLCSYYMIIFGGREIMKDREALKLNGLFKVHNFYLTVISGVLLLLFLEQLIPTIVRMGVFSSICSYEGGWTDQLVILYYACPSSSRSRLHRGYANTDRNSSTT